MRENIENIEQITTELDFNSTVLSVLREFANLTNSELFFEIDKKKQVIAVTLKNAYGFDITNSFKYVRGLIAIADYIGIVLENDNIVLSLNFNYEKIS